MGKGGGKSSARGGGGSAGNKSYKKDPSSAPIGTKLSMGGYKYTKTGSNSWRTTSPGGKRVQDRTNADIKRVFT